MPRPAVNVATATAEHVGELFSKKPSFDEIVELTKQLKFSEEWGRSNSDFHLVIHETWRPIDGGSVMILYYYEFPAVACFSHLGENTFRHFRSIDEAWNEHKQAKGEASGGDAG